MRYLSRSLTTLLTLFALHAVAVEPAVVPVFDAIDHVELKVADPNRSLAFYTHLFGAAVLAPKQGEQRYLQLGSSFVTFVPDRNAKTDHVSISARPFDGAALQDWYKREALTVETLAGGKALQVRDRDDTRVQVVPAAGWETLVAAGAVKQGDNRPGLFHPLLIDEIYLTVTNLEVDSLHYARLLGKSGTLQSGSLWFPFGSARLRLGQAPVGQKAGFNYFSVLVSSTDLNTAADAVFKSGGIIEDILPNGFSFWDPDGIRVEIHVAGQF